MEIGTNVLHVFHPYVLKHDNSNSALCIGINILRI